MGFLQNNKVSLCVEVGENLNFSSLRNKGQSPEILVFVMGFSNVGVYLETKRSKSTQRLIPWVPQQSQVRILEK
jgi:hypothetical protein